MTNSIKDRLEQLFTDGSTPGIEFAVMTVEQVAILLNISPDTVYRLIKTQKLAAYPEVYRPPQLKRYMIPGWALKAYQISKVAAVWGMIKNGN